MSQINALSIVICATDGARLAPLVQAVTTVAMRHSSAPEVVIAAGPAAAAAAARSAATYPFVHATYHTQPRRPAYLLRDACTLINGDTVLVLDATVPPSALAIERLLAAYNGHDLLVGMRVPALSHPLQRAHAALLRQILVSDQADPLLPLALFRAELIELLPGDGEPAPPLAHLYAVARRRNYVIGQVALPAHSVPARPSGIAEVATLVAQGPARGARPALGALAIAGSLWFLLRRRR
ncbi:MAG: hypothetical protein K6356_02320 [Chloroflexus sp.]